MEEERITQLITVPEWKTILLDLVEKNELDPWNIDIVRLTNLYIEEIRRRKDNDLYLPANAVLASSILLWLKSKILKQVREELEEKEEPPEEEVIFDVVEPLPEVEEPIEQSLPEPRIVPPSRIATRPISLDELLDTMEKLMKKGIKKRPVAVQLPEVEEFFEEMEEGEDVEDFVETVYKRLLERKDSTNMVLLSSLVDNDPLGFVKTLLAILYLANEKKVELFQEEVFGDIIIMVVG